MDKEDVVCIYNGILLSHKKRKKYCHLQQHGWRIPYKVKKVRQRQILYDITYMWNLENNTNESIYKTETDSQT